jgi:outer membrane protein assembly factor BamB
MRISIRAAALPAALLTVALASSAASAASQDWPIWRGPDRSGIVTEKGLAESWPADGPKELWRHKAGVGFASPVVAGGKLYLFYLDGDKDVLEALDPVSGKSLWKQGSEKAYSASYPGTRASPAIDGDKIFTYSGNGFLVGRSLADGKQLWAVDVMKETGGKQKTWGLASTPVVDGDLVYVQSGENGNAAVAVNKNDGKIAWKSDAKGGGYATPVLATVNGKPLLIVFGQKHLFGIDPKNGKTLWELNEPWETQYGVNATMPLVHDGKVFVSVAYDNAHSGLYEFSDGGIKPVWKSKEIGARFQPGVLDNGYLYINSEGRLQCVNWSDGKIVWHTDPKKERQLLGFGGSLVRFGDKLITLSDKGMLSLLQATPEGYKKISKVEDVVDGDQNWATPLIYDGKLYVKGKEELVCFDISGK